MTIEIPVWLLVFFIIATSFAALCVIGLTFILVDIITMMVEDKKNKKKKGER